MFFSFRSWIRLSDQPKYYYFIIQADTVSEAVDMAVSRMHIVHDDVVEIEAVHILNSDDVKWLPINYFFYGTSKPSGLVPRLPIPYYFWKEA